MSTRQETRDRFAMEHVLHPPSFRSATDRGTGSTARTSGTQAASTCPTRWVQAQRISITSVVSDLSRPSNPDPLTISKTAQGNEEGGRESRSRWSYSVDDRRGRLVGGLYQPDRPPNVYHSVEQNDGPARLSLRPRDTGARRGCRFAGRARPGRRRGRLHGVGQLSGRTSSVDSPGRSCVTRPTHSMPPRRRASLPGVSYPTCATRRVSTRGSRAASSIAAVICCAAVVAWRCARSAW